MIDAKGHADRVEQVVEARPENRSPFENRASSWTDHPVAPTGTFTLARSSSWYGISRSCDHEPFAS
jgi:hypothetical protein